MSTFGINIQTLGSEYPRLSWAEIFSMAIEKLANIRVGEKSYTGGVIYIPRGHYKMGGSLEINSRHLFIESGYDLASITIQGEGTFSTILDFGGENASILIKGKNDEKTNVTYIRLRDFTVQNSAKSNIIVGESTRGVANHIELTNIRSNKAGEDGIRFNNVFMISLRGVFAQGNKCHGISFEGGINTSVNASNCFAAGNEWSGWSVNDVTYSSFEACGADHNWAHGWYFKKIRNGSIKVITCGAEHNGRAGFGVESDKKQPSINVIFEGCLATMNNDKSKISKQEDSLEKITKDDKVNYPNLLWLYSDGYPASAIIKACSSTHIRKDSPKVAVLAMGDKATLIDDGNHYFYNKNGKQEIVLDKGVTHKVVQYKETKSITIP